MTQTESTDLSSRMRAYAGQNPSTAARLVPLADAFDTATAGYYSDPPTVNVRQFLGAFARARRAWCEETGEPLV